MITHKTGLDQKLGEAVNKAQRRLKRLPIA